MANVTALRAVSQPSRAPIGDFNRDRWTWLDAVQEDTALTPSAKVLASILARLNADGECFPHNDYLMKRMGGTSADTVQRAFKALAGRGWLRRSEGRGRRSKPTVTFFMQGKIVPLTPRVTAQTAPSDAAKPTETPQDCGADKAADMRFNTTEKAADMRFNSRKNAVSRIYTKNNQKERAQSNETLSRPCPHLREVAYFGSDREAEWNAGLARRGYPPLSEIGVKTSDAGGVGYDIPFRRTPNSDDAIGVRIARDWADWLMARHEARHDH